MDVYIGADHGGFKIKEELKPYIQELGHTPIDVGSYQLDAPDDYPDPVLTLKHKLAERAGKDFRAILICGSGIGICMAANKLKHVRAASCLEPIQAFFGRLHNDINTLCLSGLRSNASSIEKVTEGDYTNLIDAGMNVANLNEAKRIVKVFLTTETEASPGSRHRRRLEKIAALETAK